MEARERIGYMSHATMLYDEFSGVANLRYFASLYRGRDCVSPEDALRGVGLDPSLVPFRTEQRTIVLTTHQRELAEPLADFVLTLQAGAVVSLEEGPYAKRGALALAATGAAGSVR